MIDIKRIIRSILWIVPFLGFIFGYFFTHSFFHTKVIQTPNFIGKSVQQVVQLATTMGLNIRLLREKEDPDMVPGIVLEQSPKPRRTIKPNQYVFVTLSKKPKAILAPNVLNQNYALQADEVKKLGVRARTFWVESSFPKGFCVAQAPQPGLVLQTQAMVAYLSLGKNSLFIFPQLQSMPAQAVIEFLEQNGVKVEVFHKRSVERGHSCEQCRVLDQKPMAGTIVDKNLYVQLQIGQIQ